MERLVNVHPVLGGALDEGGLQLLRHVFAVGGGDLRTVGLFRRDERYNIGIILRIVCNICFFLKEQQKTYDSEWGGLDGAMQAYGAAAILWLSSIW